MHYGAYLLQKSKKEGLRRLFNPSITIFCLMKIFAILQKGNSQRKIIRTRDRIPSLWGKEAPFLLKDGPCDVMRCYAWCQLSQMHVNWRARIEIEGKELPGTILLEILISLCATRHDSHHTFCRLFALNLQRDPHHQPLSVQIQRQRNHALHSGQTIASKVQVRQKD